MVLPFDLSFCLRYPIGYYIHNHIRIYRVVGPEMNSEVMWTIHAFVHHEDTGLDNCAFTGLEDHRTDGKLRGSAPLNYLDVRVFLETPCAVACVRHFDGKSLVDAKLHITVIDLLLIHRDGRHAATHSKHQRLLSTMRVALRLPLNLPGECYIT